MAVRGDAAAEFRLARFGTPALRIADEKALISCKPIDDPVRLALQREAIRIVSTGKTRDIRDVLTECLMSVQWQIGKWPIFIELRSERFAGRFEMLEVCFRPPIIEPALRIELAAEIV